VIQLLHQRQQLPQFAMRKSNARKPVQILTRQIGNQVPLVFTERHRARDQQLKMPMLHLQSEFNRIRDNLEPGFCANFVGIATRRARYTNAAKIRAASFNHYTTAQTHEPVKTA